MFVLTMVCIPFRQTEWADEKGKLDTQRGIERRVWDDDDAGRQRERVGTERYA